MNFAVTGGVLSLQDLRLVASSLQASAAGQIIVETCTGSLSDITVRDSTLQVSGAQGLVVSGTVLLTTASNLQDVRITAVTFSDASLNVQATVLVMDGCDGSLIAVSLTGSDMSVTALSFSDAAITVSQGHLNLNQGCSGSLSYLSLSDALLLIDTPSLTVSGNVLLASSGFLVTGVLFGSAPLLALSGRGSVSGLSVVESSLRTFDSTRSNFAMSLVGSVSLQGAAKLSLRFARVEIAGLNFGSSSSGELVDCAGTLGGLIVNYASLNITSAHDMTLSGTVILTSATVIVQRAAWSGAHIEIASHSMMSVIDGTGSVSACYVTTQSHVELIRCSGSFSSMMVNGRSDTGPMGSCDGSVDTYCSSFTTRGGSGQTGTRTPTNWPAAYMFPNNFVTNSPTCGGEVGSCCRTTGTAELCLPSWSQFGTTASSNSECRNLASASRDAADSAFCCCTAVKYCCCSWVAYGTRAESLKFSLSPAANRSRSSVTQASTLSTLSSDTAGETGLSAPMPAAKAGAAAGDDASAPS